MTKKRISQLPLASTLDGTELIETVQGGVNKKTTAQGIADLGVSGGPLVYRKVDADNYLILTSDYVLSVNNGASDWNIILPDPTTITGKAYIIKRFDQTSVGQVIIIPAVGLVQDSDNTFDAAVGFLAANERRMFMSNGTNWEYIK